MGEDRDGGNIQGKQLANDHQNTDVDKERHKASVARLYDIFKDMSETVDEVSKWRCPYKDAKSRCTANFGCRNQQMSKVPDELPLCTGSDNLDYRSAWEL